MQHDKHSGHMHRHHPPAPDGSEPPGLPAQSAASDAHDGRHGTDASAPAPGGEHAEHDRHAGHSVAMFRDRFWISLALTIPTLFWGHMLPRALGFTPPALPGSHLIPALFGTAVFLYGGQPFLAGAVAELRTRKPGMMTLIALAILVAFVFSAAVTLGFPGMPLWEELATLVTIMLLGHWIEMRSIAQAKGALNELARLLPDMATRLPRNGSAELTEEVPLSAIAAGDLLLVRPGTRVPADGVVRTGTSTVNESMITGESAPVPKAQGDKVIGGTVNGSGSLRVAVTATGSATALAGIMRLVAEAQGSRSRAQALADRAAFMLTIIALVAGAITLTVWLLNRATPAYAIERMVTVLVVACPHALGLAIPLVIAISTTLAAQNGLLVRDRRGLEEARNIDTVVFDKTGTLTKGEFGVTAVGTSGSLTDAEALRLAAAVERDAEHPIAQGIVRSALERGIPLPETEGFEALAGRGVTARVEGRNLWVGGPALLRARELDIPADLRQVTENAAGAGRAVVYLLDDTGVRAAFVVADVVRSESREAVVSLRSQGIEVVMLTGDARAVADAVGRELGITIVRAEVLPGDKAREIKALQGDGRRVAMVGDGVNDAPALLTADVGVAIGAGTDVAVEAGDIVLVRNDPRDVPRIVALSRASYRKMVQNLWWAAGYNIVAIPLAAGVLASRGIVLSPAIAAILMSLSTVIVAVNAQLLRRTRLAPER